MRDTTITLPVGALDEFVHQGVTWVLVARSDGDDKTVESYLGFGSIAVRLYDGCRIWLLATRPTNTKWQTERLMSGSFRVQVAGPDETLDDLLDVFVEWASDERWAA